MKLTRNWLQEYVDISDLSPEEIAEHLTMLGLEVDSVTPLGAELAPLQTGLVLATSRHPNADKLTLCQVQVGEQELSIVCGAPNVRQGLRVVVALPGTVLPGNLKIGTSKIRGVESSGMICSEKELALGTSHEGIMELPEEVEHGRTFIEAMELADLGIEVDLTPNRPDCSSVIGIARELAGVVDKPLTLPVCDNLIGNDSLEFAVEIEDTQRCPRYAARLLKGIRVAPSPWWLRRRLLSVGLRPINNIVDVTNFVMLEYGQPLHAFDFDTLSGKKIVVRTPREKERSFTTLDGLSRQLDPDMLLICDAEKPVAMAGVMGGLDSEVTEKTTNVLLESACFNPVSIRQTARKLNLASDASYRFERGVDPEGTVTALNRAAALIQEIAGGEAPAEGIDRFPGKVAPKTITLSTRRSNSLLGLKLTREEIAKLLASIAIPTQPTGTDELLVTPPSFRVDIEREADLIEEVARRYGYNRIPTSLPQVSLSYPEQDADRLKRQHTSEQLTAAGYNEAINYSFNAAASIELLEIAREDQRHTTLPLLNPLSEEQGVMRTMLLPGLLDNVRRNLNYQQTAIRLFELGKVFFPTGEKQQPLEKHRLTGVLVGNRHGGASPLHFKAEEVDLLDAKGGVEALLQSMGLNTAKQKQAGGEPLVFAEVTAESREPFAEARYSLDLLCGPIRLGSLGLIRADVLRRFAIKHPVFYFDLDYDALCSLPAMKPAFSSLPVYPAVQRDIALLVAEEVRAGELPTAVRNSGDPLVESCEIFDIFRGEKIPAGYKSVALTITYRSAKKTLTEKNVEKSHAKIVELLTATFKGNIRHE
jgi:phenylalanyl-tRNA synthetase beta chain